MSVVELAPVVKTIEVARSADDAFKLFVHHLSKWWPLESHARSPESGRKAIGHVVEPRVGGRVYEVADDGEQYDWGDVLAYEPGRRFAMQWRLGAPVGQHTEVEVVFVPLTDTSCRVTLTHSHWERAFKGTEMREGYNNGWVFVFEQRYADYARGG